MNKDEIIIKFADIFEEVFGEVIEITDALTADEVDEWDSLNNIRLMSTIESNFDIQFDVSEIMGLENVGSLLAVVENKVNSK